MLNSKKKPQEINTKRIENLLNLNRNYDFNLSNYLIIVKNYGIKTILYNRRTCRKKLQFLF